MIVWPEELKSIGGENPSPADDVGSSAAVKEKLAQFNREVEAQQIRVDQILSLADVMMQNGHPDGLTIAKRKQVNSLLPFFYKIMKSFLKEK